MVYSKKGVIHLELQVAIIRCIQYFHNPILDSFFISITNLGSEAFYFIIIPIIYWSINKRAGLGLGVTLILSIYLNAFLKETLMTKRPIGYPGIRSIYLSSAGGYAFPSGHAQGTSTVWGYLTGYFKSKWLYWLGLSLIVLVSLSRLYLGVHWPIDVVGGAALGLAMAYLGLKLINNFNKIESYKYPIKIAASAIIPTALLALFTHPDSFKYLAMLSGILIGYFTDEEYIGYQPKSNTPVKSILKYSIGLVVFLSIYLGLRMLLPYSNLTNMLRYFLSGLWLTLGAPWIYSRFKL